jgi:transcriptional regulator
MYLRAAHAEFHLPTLYKFIQTNPLGIFTTAIKSPTYPLIQSSHIPWVLDLPKDGSPDGPIGTLRGHVARANPQAKAMIETLTSGSDETSIKSSILEEEVLVLFNGPVHHYVTPKFYVETKPSTGKVVSTWNYSAVQVYGKATVLFDSKSSVLEEFLNKQLDDLARMSEEQIMGYTGEEGKKTPWKVSEAPDSYIQLLKKAIIGVEIEVTRMEGKFKMSQELKDGDREGAVKGFKELGTEEGDEMARTIELRDAVKKEREGK